MTDILIPPRPRTKATTMDSVLSSLNNPPTCAKCGAKMRLARIEPQLSPGRGPGQVTFDCSCGHVQAEPGEGAKVH
jgi:hypothetical protein